MGITDSHWEKPCFSEASSWIFDLSADGVSVATAVILLGFFLVQRKLKIDPDFYFSKITVIGNTGTMLGAGDTWQLEHLCGLGSINASVNSTWGFSP